MVVGIDEAGRGPWAGPLVFGAVLLGGISLDGLTDSKKLTKKKRAELDMLIREKARAFGLGWVHAEEIDEVGMSKACELGCRRALEQINKPYGEIIIDGTVNFLKNTGKGPYVTTMKKADLLVPSVSAASIIAKVARDRYMEEQDRRYPHYGFASHVGYGTKQHRDALREYGVTLLHRKSFAPIATLLGGKEIEYMDKDVDISGTTRDTGNKSEDVAVAYLESLGYRLVDKNWKTRACEIDIVAEKDGKIYFIEVKHRGGSRHGDGFSAITAKKLQQMKFASRVYAHYHGIDDSDMQIGVVATHGDDYSVLDFLLVDE